jgi:membrane protein insertase Oxa1/YidC/SpoIIIJ
MNQKFLLLAVYVLTLTLIFQYMFPQGKSETARPNDIIVNIKSDAVTIPNLPEIEIQNHTASGWTMNPCEAISITVDSRPLSDIAMAAPDFCKSLSIGTGANVKIPMSPLAKLIAKTPGKYILTVKTPLGDRMTSFTESEPGTIRRLLTSSVYDPIYNLFVALLTWLPGHSLGWAIVVITLIIRLILLVPQHHMLQSQKKLQVIQPKIKAIQAKYKDDQAKLGMEMIELYKKE